MKKIYALLTAILLAVPFTFAYGSYDYSYNKDFEYVKYRETESASRSYDNCGYYDLDYYGYTCNNYGSRWEYSRNRDFEFGRYHEDVHAYGDNYGGYYYGGYDGYRYPAYSYDFDYDGGRAYRGYFMPYGYP